MASYLGPVLTMVWRGTKALLRRTILDDLAVGLGLLTYSVRLLRVLGRPAERRFAASLEAALADAQALIRELP